MIITVDGPSATGKSSIAKEIAKRLGYRHLDVGMMFRAVALAEMQGIKDIDVSFVDGKIFLNEKDVSDEVRSREVTNFAIQVGGDDKFKNLVYRNERKMAEKGSLVVSGRDSGSSVFPEADFKFFVEVDLDVRAKRREEDYKGKYSFDEIKSRLIERDKKDLENGTIIKPKNVVVIDNSKDSIEDIVDGMIKIIQS